MELDDIINELLSKFNTQTESFNNSIQTINFEENGSKYYFSIY